MTSIQFAIAAAFLGHVMLGYDLSVVSVFGMIALCGLVVNGGPLLNHAIILETMAQARFLVPMAISLCFGVLFSSISVLFVVPALRLVVADVQSFFSRTSFRRISKWSGNDNRFFLEMTQAEGPESSLVCSRRT